MKNIIINELITLSIQLFVYILSMYTLLSLELVSSSSTAYIGVYLVCIAYTIIFLWLFTNTIKDSIVKVKQYRNKYY